MNVVLGMWLLGRGRGEGIHCFSPGVQPLLSALVPTIAMASIQGMAIFLAPDGMVRLSVIQILLTLVLTGLPLVVSQIYAAFLGRQGLWMRYATAMLWCGWLPILLSLLADGLLRAFMPLYATSTSALAGSCLGAELYGIWLTWYITRVGLIVTRWQACVMTVLQTVAGWSLLVLLWVLPPHYNVLVDMLTPD